MSKLKWIVLAIAMAGLGGFGCGSDDDKGGGGGKKSQGELGQNGVCATDPEGAECQACAGEFAACVFGGVCGDEFGAVFECVLANCSNSDDECKACADQQLSYAACMKKDCTGASACL